MKLPRRNLQRQIVGDLQRAVALAQVADRKQAHRRPRARAINPATPVGE
jgi:hypothetical protein